MANDEPRITTDAAEIRQWTEEHGGSPARIRNRNQARSPGELRLKFSPAEDDSLEEISWEEFMTRLASERLALLYLPESEEDDGGEPFFRLVSRDEKFEETIRPLDDDAPIVWPPPPSWAREPDEDAGRSRTSSRRGRP